MNPIFLDLPALAVAISLSETTVQRLVREGAFPKPRQLSGRRVAWLVREVEAWAESRPVSELLPPQNTSRRKNEAGGLSAADGFRGGADGCTALASSSVESRPPNSKRKWRAMVSPGDTAPPLGAGQ